MSENVRKHLHHLHVLHCESCNPKIVKALLADKDVFQCVCEIAINVLRGRVTLKPSQEAELKKFKKLLYKIADKQLTLASKRKVLVQKGSGFLPALLIPALSFLSSLF